MVAPMIARLFAAVALAMAGLALPASAQQPQSRRAIAVVELYTSQGCSQCPRANRLLGMFAREDDVLALTFPVGIWDYLGWHDTFAKPEFAERQRAYSRTMRVRGRFTPQLVMNGVRQLSASDWDEARAVLDEQRRAGLSAGPEITLTQVRGGRVRATVSGGTAHAGADVWMIAYDPGPITVAITSGINRDRYVTHYNLVDWIERVGAWNGQPVWFERARCQALCAVIVQEPNGGPVIAAAFTTRVTQRRQ